MDEFSILIGGRAGDGINQAGIFIAKMFSRLGWYSFLYFDYPSLIKGGHNFAIIRVAKKKISCHKNKIDFLLALNQETVDFHREQLAAGALVIFDSISVKAVAGRQLAVAAGQIIKDLKAPVIARNMVLIGALAGVVGLEFAGLENLIMAQIHRESALNIQVARGGFLAASGFNSISKINKIDQEIGPVLTGNEALTLGLINAGLDSYFSYPMTPSSSILHTAASLARDFGLTVIHPENEIAVILMALGQAAAGKKSAVGTSGGGFCLMTEGISLAGMAEIPVVAILGQRPGPSTGLPTYSGQTELFFAIHSGQGEFLKIVLAPGDAEEAFFWSGQALNWAWQFQTPVIILTDKHLAEGGFNFDLAAAGKTGGDAGVYWNRQGEYHRYQLTADGLSPLAAYSDKEAIIKIDSYEHDEAGITTEEPEITRKMNEKRLQKIKSFINNLGNVEAVKTYGDKKSKTAILCWGSNKPVCVELASEKGYRVIQPVVLNPFPLEQFSRAVAGVEKIIVVENNAIGQLAELVNNNGFKTGDKVLRFDGRPFSLDELQSEFVKRGL